MINRLQMPQRAELVALKMGQYRTPTTPTNREVTTNQKIEKKDTVEINSTKESKEQRTSFYSPKMFEITVTTFKTLDFFMKASLKGQFNVLNGVYTSKLSVQGVFQSTTKTTTDTTSKEIEETDGSDTGTGKPPISDGDHTEKPEGGSNPSHGGGCCCCCCCHPSTGNNGSGGTEIPGKIEPVTPAEPVIPVEPEIPTEPVIPAEPDVPTEPVIPVEPEIPMEPVIPVVPVIPTEPIIPVEPDVPTEPVIPIEPVKPVEPVKPTEPEVDKDIDKEIDDSIKDSDKHPTFFSWVMDLIKKYGKFKDELDKKVGKHILTPKESLEIIKKNREFILNSIKERYPFIDVDIFKNSFK